MNMKFAAALFVVAMIAAPSSQAQDASSDVLDAQALLKAVKADRKGYVAATLGLTNAEAKKFWPLYDAYQRNLDMTGRRRAVALEGLISREKPMTDLYAKSIANELIAADESEIKARRTLNNRVLKALPAKKAARYLQLESKIRAAQASDIATMIPLIK
jgi:hypothetical protein